MANEIRLIDANAFIIGTCKDFGCGCELDKGDCCILVGDLMAAPTVDAVPVVRCPDCKYSSPKHHFDIFEWVYCTKWKTEIKRNDFCSYGERKDNGN